MCRILLRIIFFNRFCCKLVLKKDIKEKRFFSPKKMAILLNKTISSDPILLKSCRLFYEIKNYKKKKITKPNLAISGKMTTFLCYIDSELCFFAFLKGLMSHDQFLTFTSSLKLFLRNILKKNLSVYLPYFIF